MRFLPIRGDFNFPSKVAPAKSSETVFPSTGVNSGPLSMNLRFLLVILLVLVLDWVGCLRGRGRARGGLGSWSQCTVARQRGLSIKHPRSAVRLDVESATQMSLRLWETKM